MTTATSKDTVPPLDTLTGKRISLTFRPKEGGEASTQEGRVEIGSPIGLMFKEKGKSAVQLIEAEQILDVEELAAKEPNVSVKKLLPVAAGRMRQHLADRHGYPLEEANGLNEAQAEEEHADIDHGVLAHRHEEPKAKEDAEASAADAPDLEDDDDATEEDREADDF